MNVIARTDSPEIAPQSADPLDHLADTLFHKMGTDGVYARTALYEDMVERLAALITRNREARHRNHALSAGDEPRPAREIRLSEELSQSARLRLRPAWHRTRDPPGRQPLRCRRRLDHVAVSGRSRAVAGGLLSGLSDRREPRPAAQGRPAFRRRRRLLPCRAVASSRPAAIVPDARICLHRQPRRRLRFPRALDGARPGDRARSRPRPSRSITPAIPSSAGSAR